jgi:hypothetical protein
MRSTADEPLWPVAWAVVAAGLQISVPNRRQRRCSLSPRLPLEWVDFVGRNADRVHRRQPVTARYSWLWSQ